MKNFNEINLPEGVLSVLAEKKIVTPTEIQQKSIPLLLNHDGDFVGRAQTGSGKTYAFGIPLISKIDTAKNEVQAVVLTPTRELCAQVGDELTELTKNLEEIKVQAIYGGVQLKHQVKEFNTDVKIIVATPGRLMDLIKRQVINLTTLKYLILDEADQLLLRGFRTDIDTILRNTDYTYSTWLFSATMAPEVDEVIELYLNKELETVFIGDDNSVNEDIEHNVIEVIPEEKLSVLLHFLTRFGDKKGIIFCRTKSGVQKLYKQLSANKFKSGAIHGDLPQGLRNKVMDQFRENNISILIATDVASRGVDVTDVGYVLQYHIADTKEAYLHRSGRTSRVGNKGTCLTFVFEDEISKLEDIEYDLNIKMNFLELPTVKDLLINRAILWGGKVAKEKPLDKTVDKQSREAFKKQLSHMSKDEILEKLMATYLREKQNTTS